MNPDSKILTVVHPIVDFLSGQGWRLANAHCDPKVFGDTIASFAKGVVALTILVERGLIRLEISRETTTEESLDVQTVLWSMGVTEIDERISDPLEWVKILQQHLRILCALPNSTSWHPLKSRIEASIVDEQRKLTERGAN